MYKTERHFRWFFWVLAALVLVLSGAIGGLAGSTHKHWLMGLPWLVGGFIGAGFMTLSYKLHWHWFKIVYKEPEIVDIKDWQRPYIQEYLYIPAIVSVALAAWFWLFSLTVLIR